MNITHTDRKLKRPKILGDRDEAEPIEKQTDRANCVAELCTIFALFLLFVQ